jgi:thiamine biosynthesis protein ThiI
MQPVIILHHHEIILKGNNRGFFERQLLQNVRAALSGLVPSQHIGGGYGKFIVKLNSESATNEIVSRLKNVFGIANICTGLQVQQDVGEFCIAAEQILKGRKFLTIRVETKRPDKNFPVRSMDVNAHVGAFLCDKFGVRADLSNPDETIYVHIVDRAAYVYCSKVRGAGGLPSGISGRVICLISAGFDSPVAAWKLMRRGANVIFVHFHSMPYTSQQSVNQVHRLVEMLTQYQFHSKIYLVPFADIQNQIVLKTPQHLRVIFYRRMMIRVAEIIAQKEKAEALVTGEAVGQVASQTLRNIRAIDSAAEYPILRPLSGTDKEETMAIARAIGTYDISKEPYDDCCSFLAPRKPETWASLAEVEQSESQLNIKELADLALQSVSIQTFHYPQTTHSDVPEVLIS